MIISCHVDTTASTGSSFYLETISMLWEPLRRDFQRLSIIFLRIFFFTNLNLCMGDWKTHYCVGQRVCSGFSILPNGKTHNEPFGQINITNNCMCVLNRFSHVWVFVTLWTVARQAHLSMGILQARILEWVAMPSSRGSSQSRDRTCKSSVSCIGGWVFTTSTTWEAH